MAKSKVKSMSEAINMINDGDVLLTGGWTVIRRPMAASCEIIRQKKKNLHLVCGTPGTDSDMLIGAGCVALGEQSYIGHERFGHPYNFRRAVEAGPESTGFLYDDCSLQMSWLRVLAAAMGVPFLPTLSGKGSDILNPDYDRMKDLRGKHPKLPNLKFMTMKDPFWEGREVTLIPAIRADVAIVHVHEASEDGTSFIMNAPFGDRLVAMAAKTTIITAEKIVPVQKLCENPESNAIPGMYVKAVVEAPYGAHPTQMPGSYDYDDLFYKEYVDASRSAPAFNAWLKEWVMDLENHTEYVAKLGNECLAGICADPKYGYNPNLRRRDSNGH
jgi:glutaconate CoA-transferase subunit A